MTYGKTGKIITAVGITLAVGGVAYFVGKKVRRIYKEIKENEELTEHYEVEEQINSGFDKISAGLNEEEESDMDFEEEDAEQAPDFQGIEDANSDTPEDIYDESTDPQLDPENEDWIEDGMGPERFSFLRKIRKFNDIRAKYPDDILPVRIGDEVFNELNEVRNMRFEPGSGEAAEQFKMFMMADFIDTNNTDIYTFLDAALETDIAIDRESDENLILELREYRENFFGHDAPEIVLSRTTFGELFLFMAKKVDWDWGDGERECVYFAERMLENVNWDYLLLTFGFDNAVNIIMNNDFAEDNIDPDYGIGFFGLPVDRLNDVISDKNFGFLVQYNESNFGED